MSDDGRRLLVWTGAETWKIRRLRNDSRVVVAPSTFRGAERGNRIAGRARLVPDPGIDDLLRHKYGWQKRLLDRVSRRSDPQAFVTVEIAD